MWFGTELRSLSKAAFCWLRLHLLVSVYWATFVCSQVKFRNMAQMLVPLKPRRKALPPFKQTRPEQGTHWDAGQISACVVVFDGNIGKDTWVESCTDTGAAISE